VEKGSRRKPLDSSDDRPNSELESEPNSDSSEVQSEVKKISVQVEDFYDLNPQLEPKSENLFSEQVPKLKEYNGRGRKNTDAQVNVILDWYLTDGILPVNVSDRQRYYYRHHPRLDDRRKLLEQAGLIRISRGKKNSTNVLPVGGAKVRRKRRASSDL
jgi:hypothetical protein